MCLIFLLSHQKSTKRLLPDRIISHPMENRHTRYDYQTEKAKNTYHFTAPYSEKIFSIETVLSKQIQLLDVHSLLNMDINAEVSYCHHIYHKSFLMVAQRSYFQIILSNSQYKPVAFFFAISS